MSRRLCLAALLFLQATLTAQDGASIAVNPVQNDSLWRFHLGASEYARARDTIARGSSAPDVVAAYFRISDKRGALRSAHGLLTATPSELARGLDLIVDRSHDFSDDGTTLRAEFASFVEAAGKRVDSLSREDGAEPAVAVIWLQYNLDRGNEDAHQQRVQAYFRRYGGTLAAAEFEVSQVEGTRMDLDFDGRLRRFRELATKYDRTVAGAKALYLLGFRLGNPSLPDKDPTDRLSQVFEIVKELESGRFPSSNRWVDDSAKLIPEFYYGLASQIPAASMPRIYDRYLEFVLAHPTLLGRAASDGAFDWIVRNGVGRLGSTPAERLATVERFFLDLEQRQFGLSDIRMMRARFFQAQARPEMLMPESILVDAKSAAATTTDSLRVVRSSADPAAAPIATATLASHYLGSGLYTDARAQYRLLAAQFPTAEWNWVVALRVAQLTERLGDASVVTDYEAVASRPGLPPAAILVSRVSAAELREARGELPAAASHYRAALDAWQQLPDQIRIDTQAASADRALPVFARFSNLTKASVITRTDRLSKAVSTEEALLYEGRRALENAKPAEAMGPLRKLMASYPKSNAAIEGRGLLRRAQLTEILSTPQTDLAKADRDLNALADAPYDSVTTLSKLARSAFKLRAGAQAEAEALARQALEEWHAKQSTVAEVKTPLAQEVAAIRAELFRPQGGGVFDAGRWDGLTWQKEARPFAIASREVQVKTNAKEERISAPFAAKVDARLLFATYDDLASMRMILDKVGGTATAPWIGVMDVPNQPIGGSMRVAQLWSKLFPMRPGHWGGWILTVVPYVTRITFDRDNHALAEFTAGYSGGTVELEKENGVWVAKRIVSVWIT